MIGGGTEADAGQMGGVLSDWIDETPWMPRLHSRRDDLAFCAALLARSDVLVWRDGPEIQGFVSVEGQEVAALYVAAGARGRGIGQHLLSAAKQGAHAPLSLWTFQANRGAVRFYQREGFEEIQRTDGAGNEERLPDVRLQWRGDK